MASATLDFQFSNSGRETQFSKQSTTNVDMHAWYKCL